ncbi:MAG TPA: dynamin family protein [Bryobacteraceae bacterium]|nr:dynamin family protein [Bryobacteraceae bacterium]
MSDSQSGLNESHQRRLLSALQYVDKLLSEMEAVLAASFSKSPFPKYVVNFTPAQERVVRDYIARARSQMLRAVAGLGLYVPGPQFEAIHALRVHLSFIRVALQEASPKDLAGYGPVPPELIPELNGFSTELQNLMESLNVFLAQSPGRDLADRLDRLAVTGDHVVLLKKLERIVSEYGFVEFRSALAHIVDRLSAPRFEIAVFGQVSSGKSSLLNAITGLDVLPVGVNPVTSVPTRLTYGPPSAIVSFASGQEKIYDLAEIGEFVTEDCNSGNTKGVARIVVSMLSDRLSEGIVFVDTPGLGSLATAGAAETKAYLPECDLGLVLINASATLSPEDVQLIHTLYLDGIPALILLSKSDLIGPADRDRAVQYIRGHVRTQLGIDVPVYPVSVLPSCREIMEAWFDAEIEPLYSRYRELGTTAVKRKIGVLRDSVEAALSAKLDGSTATNVSQADLEAAEKALRSVAGQISETEKKCYELTDDLRNIGPEVAIEQAELELARISAQIASSRIAETVREALKALAAEQAAAVHQCLVGLAQDLSEAMRKAGQVLHETNGLEPDKFAATFRELPQIDLSRVDVKVERPGIVLFARRIFLYRAKRQLKTQATEIEAAFTSYARLLQAWARSSLKKITEIFESHAGPERAQLERLMARTTVSPEMRLRIAADLAGIHTPDATDGDAHSTCETSARMM